jgi:hypothetical protein
LSGGWKWSDCTRRRLGACTLVPAPPHTQRTRHRPATARKATRPMAEVSKSMVCGRGGLVLVLQGPGRKLVRTDGRMCVSVSQSSQRERELRAGERRRAGAVAKRAGRGMRAASLVASHNARPPGRRPTESTGQFGFPRRLMQVIRTRMWARSSGRASHGRAAGRAAGQCPAAALHPCRGAGVWPPCHAKDARGREFVRAPLRRGPVDRARSRAFRSW